MRKYNRIINPNADFVKIQLHDRVWGFLWGWGIVVNIDLTKEYPIEVVFANKGHEFYNFVGKFYRDINQSLFWDVVHFDIPPCPKIPIMLRTTHDILNTSEGLVEFFGKEIMATRSKGNDGKMIYSYEGNKINPEWIDQSVHEDHKVKTIKKSIDQVRKVIDVVRPRITEKIAISIKEIHEIRALRGKKSQAEIAKIYKITSYMVSDIQLGKLYKHIPNPDKSKYIPPKSKLTPEEVQEIRALRRKKSQAEIAKIYKLSIWAVCRIQLGRSYNYILNPDKSKYIPAKYKLTSKEVQEIRELRGKKTQPEIAKIYKITFYAVSKIQRGKTYKNVLNPDGSPYISPKSRKFTPKEIQEIRALRGKKSQAEIAKIYKITFYAVSDIQLGKLYKYIPNPDKSKYIPPKSKFTPKEVQEIRALRGKKSQAEIARIYKITYYMVSNIQLGKNYKYVPNPDGSPYIPPSNHKRLDKKLSQKLFTIPDVEVKNIRRFFKEGVDTSIIAEHFNRNPSLIYKIVRGRIFKDVLDADGNQYIYVPRIGLSKKLAREIKKSYYEDKMSTTNICLKYHVSSDNVIKIIHKLIYRDTEK